MPVYLPHFLPCLSSGGGRGDKLAGDTTGFVGFGNFSFSSLLACLASPCTFLVQTVVVVCTDLYLFFLYLLDLANSDVY